MDFFYDTYAIMSLIEGSENYSGYKSNIITTSILNFGELYNILLRSHGKQTADYWAKKFNFNLNKSIVFSKHNVLCKPITWHYGKINQCLCNKC